MRIIVCVKVIKGEINPFDGSALECALRLSDDVTVVTMGPESAKEALLPLTRLGAKAVLLSDPVFAGSDTLATSYVLSEAIKMIGYDLVICGRQSIDGDTAQVGPMISARLGIPVITCAMNLDLKDNAAHAVTRDGNETATLPAVVTLEKGFVLRFPSIFSKVGKVEVLNNSHLGCDASRCGLSGSPTRVLKTFENQKGRRNCKFITRNELLSLIQELREKTYAREEKCVMQKLKSVWAVGHDVAEIAADIADEVITIPKLQPDEIAQRAAAARPEVILWSADLWGRKNAPIVAAMLETGLCADCTELEADEDELIMYRPAGGGNVYAKIRCITRPQMATCRTKEQNSDIYVACGKGVSEYADKVFDFAKSIGAACAASRGLVDIGKAPYEMQVGLTGKTVSPRIYIAVGISGAVHHTCAIEGADTVIAINPDKNARIFDYADYGLLENF